MTPLARLVEIARDLAAGRLSANHERGTIGREGMTIGPVQKEPHSTKRRLRYPNRLIPVLPR